MILRRNLLLRVAVAAVAAPFQALAQPKMWRIGFLTPRAQPTMPDRDAFSDAFTQGMRALGYNEGQNLTIEWRYADGDYERLTSFAVELVQMNPPVIATYGTAAARVLQKATKTIPIVFAAVVDPIGSGIVATLARPGGNITGLSVTGVEIGAKQLEFLKTMLPMLARVAVLLNPGNAAHPMVLKNLEAAAPMFGVTVQAVNADAPEAIVRGFAQMARDRADAVIIASDAFFSGQGRLIAEAALNNRIPTISIYLEHVAAGTLMSYGQNVAEYHRQAATYVDKILKGTRPEDLPVEEPTRIELVINSKTADKLGLKVASELLARANRVIE
jgi:putative tryptophan/tyrosine transport system substrate-binding protein